MRIKLLATASPAPDFYSFSGETVTAHYGGETESYDLSDFPEGGLFKEADLLNGVRTIRNIKRNNGELQVVLCQQVGPGHWKESDWIDVEEYDPDEIHVVVTPKDNFTGTPWAKTKKGKITVSVKESSNG